LIRSETAVVGWLIVIALCRMALPYTAYKCIQYDDKL